ncbi:TPA: transcriptional regulator CynR [Citrobacter farmeri]|uniref:transcriptional regulator CynR n=1 Tax=Citrobacter farmeri TaxID=67824 RepID=UPI00189863DB|nr:transcriptional regulator CynR [Citrobacter farmeri]MBU5646592.1 transcriptional regulator CynR [Pluralibacter sp. S54_ASV_43]HAT3753958.1 transcriptional regulator CynR [Citrobacter amalonaticus]HAU5701287.1 transcriptional regulator CynR [Citrobacter freundii]EHK0944076.1 transcriptional regulator CynR [Citrobacter farmeri]EKU0080475.1 transcriptional regulator CynR [Citrobacter farmeri]
MLDRHTHYFLAVAEHHGFTRAAAALHVSQPALSQQIRQLEEMLAVQLFDRSGRTTRLTDAGEVYLRYARSALQALEEGKRAIHDVEDLSRGALRVAVTPTFTAWFIGPLLAEFHTRYPNVTLQLQELSQDKIEEMLVNDELDVGIAFDQVHSADIDAQPLLTENLALVVANHHPLAVQASVDLRVLNDEKLILLNAEFATREQIDRYCLQAGLRPQILMEANSISAVLELVRRTGLSTLLPAPIAEQSNDLQAISLTPQLLERTAVLLQRKGAWRTAAARAFVAMAQEGVKAVKAVS